ncbi:MAG: hypothetical protein HY842_06765 [Bacteroidetes bacterium]|nr:hypothetical protein [Bacteroidota bacterium]
MNLKVRALIFGEDSGAKNIGGQDRQTAEFPTCFTAEFAPGLTKAQNFKAE